MVLGESANIGLFDIVVLTSLLYSSESWIFYTYIFDKPAFGNENNEVIFPNFKRKLTGIPEPEASDPP